MQSAVEAGGPHERRWHPLYGQWVIIAAAANARPWQGITPESGEDAAPAYEPGCYLCAGNERAGGRKNPRYRGPFSFDNDFAALSEASPAVCEDAAPLCDAKGELPMLLRRARADGACRVLVWSERHDRSLADLDASSMDGVAKFWQSEVRDLYARTGVVQVCLFENKGREIGMSNPHPHGQAYALSFVSEYAQRFRHTQQAFRQEQQRDLLPTWVDTEHARRHLQLDCGEHFITAVPFAARFPYETLIVPRRAVRSITELSATALSELGRLVQRQLGRLDRLFARVSPGTMLFHEAPRDDDPANEAWCFHVQIQPHLVDAHRQKFLAGFESLSGNIVNPVQPEQAAQQLRNVTLDDQS